MRKSNKIIALVLSIILTVSMSATVFAATKAKPNEWDSFGTSAEGPKYPQIRGEYRTVDSLVGIKKKQKESRKPTEQLSETRRKRKEGLGMLGYFLVRP